MALLFGLSALLLPHLTVGVIVVVFGIFAIIFPGAGILSLTWLLGAYAILFGITLIALGFEIQNWSRRRGRRSEV